MQKLMLHVPLSMTALFYKQYGNNADNGDVYDDDHVDNDDDCGNGVVVIIVIVVMVMVMVMVLDMMIIYIYIYIYIYMVIRTIMVMTIMVVVIMMVMAIFMIKKSKVQNIQKLYAEKVLTFRRRHFFSFPFQTSFHRDGLRSITIFVNFCIRIWTFVYVSFFINDTTFMKNISKHPCFHAICLKSRI